MEQSKKKKKHASIVNINLRLDILIKGLGKMKQPNNISLKISIRNTI